MSNALDISHLSVSYDKISALWDLSFQIPKASLACVVGPNGAGKSTLLKAALGLIPSLSGKVLFLGQPLDKVRQKIAYVPQRESVDWDFPITCLDLVLMGCFGRIGLMRRPKPADRAKAMHVLSTVKMEGFAHRQISQLSGGQQQRVFLARALMQDAELYLMDEPFAGIDMGTEKLLVQVMRSLQEQGKTLVVVHHDLNTVEDYFDWSLLLNIRLVASGPTQEVFNPQNLNATYGKSYALFGEALKLSQQKERGIR